MRTIACLVAVLCLSSGSVAFAKRSAPEAVKIIRTGELELRAPHEEMGCIEAWDVKTNQLLWRRQVYVVKYGPGLERDAQDVFIKSMELKEDTIVVTNERGSEYVLDLCTLDVKLKKGLLVENRERKRLLPEGVAARKIEQ